MSGAIRGEDLHAHSNRQIQHCADQVGREILGHAARILQCSHVGEAAGKQEEAAAGNHEGCTGRQHGCGSEQRQAAPGLGVACSVKMSCVPHHGIGRDQEPVGR